MPSRLSSTAILRLPGAADLFDALDLLACIAGLARAMRTPAFGFGLFLPAVERGAGMADRLGRLVGGKAQAHGAAPAQNGVASSLGFAIWGLRRKKTRRRPSVSDNVSGQATNLHGVLLRLFDSQLSASENPSSFSIKSSHMFLNPDSGFLCLR